jgi:PspA-Associated protein
VIVRIATEGQYELQGDDEGRLKELDDEAIVASEGSDEQHFRAAFDRLLDFVRTHGRAIPDDALAASDLILPPPDTTLHEARAEFTGEGLIPG